MKKYIRKKQHINYVRNYVCDLHNEIFKLAIHDCLHPTYGGLYIKYNRYLRLLEF